jgi:hypothetical protein
MFEILKLGPNLRRRRHYFFFKCALAFLENKNKNKTKQKTKQKTNRNIENPREAILLLKDEFCALKTEYNDVLRTERANKANKIKEIKEKIKRRNKTRAAD